VLLYSGRGVARAPALALAYLMDTYALSYIEAISFLRHRMPTASLTPSAIEAVLTWIAARPQRYVLPSLS
jgi:hypothetical protein